MIGPRPSRVTIPFISGGAAPAPIFLDTFTGAAAALSSHTPEVGSWVITGTSPNLNGSGLLKLNRNLAATQIELATGAARFDATWDFSYDALWGSNLVIVFNVLNFTTDRWHVYFSPPYVQLYQVISSVQTQRGVTFTDSTSATSIRIRITTNEGTDGDTINVYINGTLQITWTAANRHLKNETGMGMRSFISSNDVYIDKVEVLP